MAKPLDNFAEHSTTDGAGAQLSVTSYGKLPKVCEDQLDRLFRCGSDLLEEQSGPTIQQRVLMRAS